MATDTSASFRVTIQTPLAKRWRERGFNAERLAQVLDISPMHMYNIGAGRSTPSFTLLRKLCHVLDARPDELFPELSPNSEVQSHG